MPENRNYKSDVFSMLLENPVYALEVYNALNGTDYQNPSGFVQPKTDSDRYAPLCGVLQWKRGTPGERNFASVRFLFPPYGHTGTGADLHCI